MIDIWQFSNSYNCSSGCPTTSKPAWCRKQCQAETCAIATHTHTWKWWVLKLSEAAQWRYGNWVALGPQNCIVWWKGGFSGTNIWIPIAPHLDRMSSIACLSNLVRAYSLCQPSFFGKLSPGDNPCQAAGAAGQKQQRHVVNVAQCSSLFWRCGRVC